MSETCFKNDAFTDCSNAQLMLIPVYWLSVTASINVGMRRHCTGVSSCVKAKETKCLNLQLLQNKLRVNPSETDSHETTLICNWQLFLLKNKQADLTTKALYMERNSHTC